MAKPLFHLEVLSESYVEVRKLSEPLWAGALMYFPDPPELDVKCYMMMFDAGLGEMIFVNWVGYKAGLRLVLARIPASAMNEGSRSVPLGWFKDNWHNKFLPFGSFETTIFLKWQRTPNLDA